MNYISYADLGGREERRVITPEPENQVFHEPWEPRVFGLVLAMNAVGLWNLDMNRSARETLPDYLQLSYYEIWLAALEKNLWRSGALTDGAAPPRVLHACAVAAVLAQGSPYSREPTRPALFDVGQAVRTRAEPCGHHTRLPAYARGKVGLIQRIHGVHVFADSNAQGLGESPQWLYNVTFDGSELWEDAAHSVSIDAWEPYLSAA